jgi:exopolyphosphatase/guanosine-5'-triphosphate,3'-diphosphate pyrophosphatase
VQPVLEESQQTRLGQGFYKTHRLRADAIVSTAAAVAQFVQSARGLNAASIRVIATSAARDAKNPDDLASAIELAAGSKLEIISGEQEADWAFQGVTSAPELAQQSLLLLDVGGGSTEFILGHGQHKHFRQSFPLGTVRLMEKLPHSDPPKPKEFADSRAWLKKFVAARVRPELEPALRREMGAAHGQVQIVGTGGTATILARMETRLEEFDRQRLEAARLGLHRVRWHAAQLWGLPLEQRKKTVGLPGKRADVILMGVIIYEAVMAEFGFSELRVSTRGLRFAAVMDGAS